MKLISILLLVILFNLAGCSFSKDKLPAPLMRTSQESKKTLSETQKNILTAIKINNLNKLKAALDSAQPQDFIFPKEGSTPMGLALQIDRKEFVELLVSSNVDPTNLGDQQEIFNSVIYLTQIQKIYTSLNLTERVKENNGTINSSQALLFEKYLTILSNVTALIQKNDFVSAIAAYHKTPINCEFMEAQSIFLYMQNGHRDFTQIEKFLSKIDCKPSLKKSEIEEIYHVELTRQFQHFFSDGSLLSYITRHPSLTSLLWNIDNSGFWVSPNLLFRIAFDEENRYLTKKSSSDFCEPPFGPDFEGCYLEEEMKTYAFFKNNNILLPDYELIHTKNGSIVTTYSFFRRQVVNSQDDFYEKVSYFLHGKKVYYDIEDPNERGTYIQGTVEKPWQIGFQEMDDDVVD